MIKFDLESLSPEASTMCWINERFEKEAWDVKLTRFTYATLMDVLLTSRKEVWQSEAGRNLSIAITHLEDSCIRAIKAFYS